MEQKWVSLLAYRGLTFKQQILNVGMSIQYFIIFIEEISL